MKSEGGRVWFEEFLKVLYKQIVAKRIRNLNIWKEKTNGLALVIILLKQQLHFFWHRLLIVSRPPMPGRKPADSCRQVLLSQLDHNQHQHTDGFLFSVLSDLRVLNTADIG